MNQSNSRMKIGQITEWRIEKDEKETAEQWWGKKIE